MGKARVGGGGAQSLVIVSGDLCAQLELARQAQLAGGEPPTQRHASGQLGAAHEGGGIGAIRGGASLRKVPQDMREEVLNAWLARCLAPAGDGTASEDGAIREECEEERRPP